LRKHPRAFVIVHTVRRAIIATMAVIPFIFANVEVTETDNVLGANDNGREIQALHGATAIAPDRSAHINDAEPSVPSLENGRPWGMVVAREWTHPSGTPWDVEEQEAKAFTNASVLSEIFPLSVSI
jgi:hypothetical protein